MAISESIIEKIKQITPEDLASHGVITPAKTKANGRLTYICPFCGNGKGKSGDGLAVYENDYGFSYTCFGGECGGKSYDNIELFKKFYNESNFVEVCKRTCKAFGIEPETTPADEKLKPARSSEKKPVSVESTKITAAPVSDVDEKEIEQCELEMIKEDTQFARKHLNDLPESERRAILPATYEKFGGGYVEKWNAPKHRAELKFGKRDKLPPPSRRIILVAGNHYNAILPNADRTSENKQWQKIHAGKKYPFGLETVSNETEYLILLEGEMDAISMYQSLDNPSSAVKIKKFGTVATCGAISGGAVAEKIIERLNAVKFKGKVLIVYDQDDTGKKLAPQLTHFFIERGYPAVCDYLPTHADGTKRDANDILVEGNDGDINGTAGEMELCNLIQKMIERNANNWNVAKNEIEQIKTAEYCFKTIKGDTDLDNALRLIHLQNGKLRYLSDVDKFAFFNDNDHVWQESNKNSPLNHLIVDAANILGNSAKTPTENKIANIFKSNRKSSGITAMVKGVRVIRITRADFDKHKNLLNCQNGVVDLQTGRLYPAAPELLLMQCTNANYLPNWKENPVEVVDNFLRDVQSNEDTRGFLIQWLGYCLTAEVNEEKFVLFQGAGGNGKGTLTNLVNETFNNYCVSFPVRALQWNKNADANAATTAFNLLEKARLAISEEIPPNAKADPSVLKLLSGGDKIPIRRLFEESRHIEPTSKLILSGNNALIFPDATDYGIQRRLIAVKFEQDFRNKPDVHLKEKLLTQEAKDYFLSMLIDSAQEWYKNGLQVPKILQETSKEYLDSQDFITDFISEYCERRAEASITRTEFVNKLREIYPRETPTTQKALSEMLEKIEGVEYVRSKKGMILKGIDKCTNW